MSPAKPLGRAAKIARRAFREINPIDYIPFLSKQTFHFHIRSSCLEGMTFGILSLSMIIARKTLHASPWQLSVLTSAPVIGFLFTIYMGNLASMHRKMPIITYPRIAGSIILITIIFCPNALYFTGAVAAAYILWAIALPAQVGIFGLNYPNVCRARAYSVAQTLRFAAMVLASYVGSLCLQRNPMTYRPLFVIAGALGLLAIMLFRKIRVRRERFTATKPPLQMLKDSVNILRRNRLFAAYLAAFFLFGFANLMLSPLRVLTLNDRLGADYTTAALALTVIPQAMALFTMILWGPFVDRHSPITLRALMNIIWAIYPISYWLAERYGNVHYTYTAAMAMGFASSGSMLVWTLGSIYFAPKEEIPVYTAIHATLAGVRSATAPFFGIWLANALGRPRVYLICFCMMFISAAMMMGLSFMDRKRRSRGKTAT